MAKVVKKSAVPLYFPAVVWLIWGLFFPLYKLSHFAILAVVSFVAWAIGKQIFCDVTVEVPDPPAEPVKLDTQGDPRLDALIEQRDQAMAELHRLNDQIPDETVSAQIDHLEEVTGKIVTHVVEHPDKLPQIRKFMSYYLPTTIKLLNTYARMDSTGVAGSNIDGTMGRIETMMETSLAAFDKQLDALFGDEALDIATDITVMETMLKQEGLSEEQPFESGGMQL